MNDANIPAPPSSADLREAARWLAKAEAEGIYSEDCARAVATVATWLHQVADAEDARWANALVEQLLANSRRRAAAPVQV